MAKETEIDSGAGVDPDGDPVVQKAELVQALIIGGGAVGLFLLTFTFDEVSESLAQGIGPAVFPRAILLILIFLAVLLGYRALKPTLESAAKYKPAKSIPKIVYLSAGLLTLFVVGLNFIGALPSVVVFCVALSLLWGERRYGLIAVTFAIFTGAVYLLFDIALNTNLPTM